MKHLVFRFSFESGYNKSSRRHSLDSQMSLRVSDVERMAALHTVAKFGRHRRSNWLSMRKGRKGQAKDRRSSRGSNASDDSNFGSLVSLFCICSLDSFLRIFKIEPSRVYEFYRNYPYSQFIVLINDILQLNLQPTGKIVCHDDFNVHNTDQLIFGITNIAGILCDPSHDLIQLIVFPMSIPGTSNHNSHTLNLFFTNY